MHSCVQYILFNLLFYSIGCLLWVWRWREESEKGRVRDGGKGGRKGGREGGKEGEEEEERGGKGGNE